MPGRSESMRNVECCKPGTPFSSTPKPSRRSFAGGEYLTWYLRGDGVEFVITKVAGPNRVRQRPLFRRDSNHGRLCRHRPDDPGQLARCLWGRWRERARQQHGELPPIRPGQRDLKQQPHLGALHRRCQRFAATTPRKRTGGCRLAIKHFLHHRRRLDRYAVSYHEVSLYLLDFDNAGRSESIEVLNAANNAILINPQTVSILLAGGEYLDWNLRGNVEFVITKVTGPNACVSGLLFQKRQRPTATFVRHRPDDPGQLARCLWGRWRERARQQHGELPPIRPGQP